VPEHLSDSLPAGIGPSMIVQTPWLRNVSPLAETSYPQASIPGSGRVAVRREQEWARVVGGKRSTAVECSYKNRRMARAGDMKVLGFKGGVLGRGGDEWPFRALQGSCAGAAALPSRPDVRLGFLTSTTFSRKSITSPLLCIPATAFPTKPHTLQIQENGLIRRRRHVFLWWW
jgi:hypothetical protein